jgi:hypothetical protein
VPSDAHGKYTIQITFDMGPVAGKVTGKLPLQVGK